MNETNISIEYLKYQYQQQQQQPTNTPKTINTLKNHTKSPPENQKPKKNGVSPIVHTENFKTLFLTYL